MKLLNKIFLQFLIISPIFCFLASNSQIFAANPPAIQIQFVTPDKVSSGEKSKAKFYIQRTEENKTTEYTFKLSTNNSSLITLSKTEIKLLPGEERAEFDFEVLGTPIITSASIKVKLETGTPSQAENTIQIVPALLKSVTAQPSMIGTYGGKVEISVELRGSAPTGGIGIYLSPIFVAGLNEYINIQTSNIQIPAGSKKTSFFIEYEAIRSDGSSVSRIDTLTIFNKQKRSIELIVAVEPQQSSGSRSSLQWQQIPLVAIKTKFDVIPLQVTSISVQPTTINGGNEALGSFTLNAAPGNFEKILSRPRRSSGNKLWIKPLGASCQETESNPNVEIILTQGVTNYSFKVCTTEVTTATNVKIEAFLRSGKFETTATVQP